MKVTILDLGFVCFALIRILVNEVFTYFIYIYLNVLSLRPMSWNLSVPSNSYPLSGSPWKQKCELKRKGSTCCPLFPTLIGSRSLTRAQTFMHMYLQIYSKAYCLPETDSRLFQKPIKFSKQPLKDIKCYCFLYLRLLILLSPFPTPRLNRQLMSHFNWVWKMQSCFHLSFSNNELLTSLALHLPELSNARFIFVWIVAREICDRKE